MITPSTKQITQVQVRYNVHIDISKDGRVKVGVGARKRVVCMAETLPAQC